MSQADPRHDRRRDFLVLGAIAAALIFLFADILFLGNGLFLSDITTYAYPMKSVVRATLLSGEFPYWNPFYSGGEPLAANPAYNLYYPLQWLVLLPSLHFAVQFQIVLHFFIGTAGTYVLSRAFGLTPAAASLGAVAFGFSGFLLGLANLLPILLAFSWTPWLLAFIHLLIHRRRPVFFLAASLTFAMQVLISEPGTILQSLVMIGGYFVIHAWRVRRDLFRSAALLAGVVIVALAISAVQLIPALDFVGETTRGRGFSWEAAKSWSMRPIRPLELLFPSLYGSVDASHGLYWGYRRFAGFTRPFLWSIYAGTLTVILALGGVVLRLRGWGVFVVVFAGCFLVAVGGYGPVFKWLHNSGILATVRYPERFFVPVLLAFAVFAALVFQKILDGERRVVIATAAVAAFITVAAAIAAATTYFGDYRGRFLRRWELPDVPRATAMAHENRSQWWIASLRAALAAGVLLWRLKGRTTQWNAAVWIYIVADLGLLSNRVLLRMPQDFFTQPEIGRRLPPDRDRYRIFNLGNHIRTGPDATTYANMRTGTSWIVRNGLILYTPVSWGFRTVHEPSIDETKLAWAQETMRLFGPMSERRPQDWADRVAAMSNARFQLYWRRFEVAMTEAGGDPEKVIPVVVVEGPPHPRYYFADRVVTIRGRDDFLNVVTSAGFTPRTAAVFGAAFAPSPGTVRVLRETNNVVELDVEVSAPAYLVAANTFQKYWSATIDDAAVPVERANFMFQGIRVGAGRHRVKFSYRNPLVLPTLAFSAGTLAILVAVCVFLTLRRRPL